MWKEKPAEIPIRLISGYDERVGHVLVVQVGDIQIPILISSNN